MNIEAFILIGGRSTRLGSDKVFAKIGGRSLGDMVLNAVRRALPKATISLVAGNDEQVRVASGLFAGAEVIGDRVKGAGPIGGLHAALSIAASEYIFVTACDYPFASPELITLLVSKAGGVCDAVVPRQPDGRLQPLLAVYRVGPTLEALTGLLERKVRSPSMRDIVENLDPHIVEPDEYGLLLASRYFFVNVNTVEALNAAEALFSARVPGLL